MKTLLDHGHIDLVETWGSDERIIESARAEKFPRTVALFDEGSR